MIIGLKEVIHFFRDRFEGCEEAKWREVTTSHARATAS
jgi:hypothetical protein